jgi:hypothetical protein
VHAVPEVGHEVGAAGVDGWVDGGEEGDGDFGGEGDAVARVGCLDLVVGTTVGCGAEAGTARGGYNVGRVLTESPRRVGSG